MTDYTPSGDPLIGSRGLSNVIRDEFNNIATAISSKENVGALSTVSITPTAIPGSVPSNVTQVWETGKSFVPGYYIMMTDTANPAVNNMFGMLVSYNSTNGIAIVNVTSKNGSGTISAWTIVTSSPSSVTLGTNTFSGAQNFARATVVSAATTADIWNVLGNQIDFTGTATVTGFPAAPQAGSWRELICAGACSFTAGANLLINGVSSGSTITCAANDIVMVRAITTTQFILTVFRYNGFGVRAVQSHLSTMIYTANGVGSVNTNVRLFTTTAENTLGATVSHSATNGSSITVPVSGLYFLQARDNWATIPNNSYFGISRNAITGIETAGNLAALAVGRIHMANATLPCISAYRYLAANDIIRLLNVYTGGRAFDGTTDVQLTVTLINYA